MGAELSANASRRDNVSSLVPTTEEQREELRTCSRNAFFWGGLPVSVGMHFARKYFMSKGMFQSAIQAPNTVNVVVTFATNFIIGTVLFLPFCVRKQLIIEAQRQQTLQNMELIKSPSFEESGLKEDVNFQSTLFPGLDGPNTNFSHLDLEIDSSVGDRNVLENVDDPKVQPAIPPTTYYDLRKHHRENYIRQISDPSFRQDTRPVNSPRPNSPKSQQSEFPQKRVIKNKYGDEVEV